VNVVDNAAGKSELRRWRRRTVNRGAVAIAAEPASLIRRLLACWIRWSSVEVDWDRVISHARNDVARLISRPIERERQGWTRSWGGS
jgi:hypothetical protein